MNKGNHAYFDNSVDILRGVVSDFDEIWVVGDISSKAWRFLDLKITNKFWLIHVDNYTWEECDEFLVKPPKLSQDYIHEITDIDREQVATRLKEVKDNNKKIYVSMPRANKQLEELINEMELGDNVVLWSPCDFNQNLEIENKITFMNIMNEIKDNLEIDVIPSLVLSGQSYQDVLSHFWVSKGYPLYVQTWLSAWWDGTRKIKSPEEWESLMPNLSGFMQEWQVKVTLWVTGWYNKEQETYFPAYSSNFQACNIPDEKWSVRVILDPWSMKPTGIPSLWIQDTPTWLGNDRSNPHMPSIIESGMHLFENIWKSLRDKYKYTWVWWPDCIIWELGDWKMRIFCNEVNPREQWTSIQQILNAKLANRVPLHVVHTLFRMSKVSEKAKKWLEEVLSYLDDNYNYHSMTSRGWFYVKIMQPYWKESEVKNDISWIYEVNLLNNTLKRIDCDMTESELMMCNKENEDTVDTMLIKVKWPSIGTKYLGNNSVSKIGTISWYCPKWYSVFDSQKPDFTTLWVSIYTHFMHKLFHNEDNQA